jgi:2-polyprenyl-3-methyl-5-hydroxy-6-metoxy-1,4-benzoquinol methylase
MDARIAYEACPLCDDRGMDEVGTASCAEHPRYKPELPPTLRWVRCRACGHVFVDGYFTGEALGVLYAGRNPHQTPGHDMEPARNVSARMVERVAALRPRCEGRWLDIGFGNGSLLATAAEFGWDVVGIDAREDNVRDLRALGFEAHAVDLLAYDPPERLDVISMADVLEHMAFPRQALEHVARILRDDGLLFLSMPNADCFVWQDLTRRGVNPYWAEIEHQHNFGRRRLYRLLHACGFAPLRYDVGQRYRAQMEVIAEKALRAARPG